MTARLSRDAVRTIDRIAIEEFAIPGMVLMENAGRGAAELLQQEGIAGRVVICCGKGNNGGDGFVIARHLEAAGYAVQVLLFADPRSLRGDAAANYEILDRSKTPIRIISDDENLAGLAEELAEADWIVDALLGTGAVGPLRDPFAAIVRQINTSPARVLAVDLPSGMDADTADVSGGCIRATLTSTFVAEKLGFAEPSSQSWTGRVTVVDIGLPKRLLERYFRPPSAG